MKIELATKGVLTAISGMAGSGKSSLITQELVARYPEAIVIDQKPIGISSRSTPTTFTGSMDDNRKLFAAENNVGAEWFSFNSKGACLLCNGKGEIKPEVAFADPVAILCEECDGHRYNPTALSYRFQGKGIEEALALTIEQALTFFKEAQSIATGKHHAHLRHIPEIIKRPFDVAAFLI